MVPVDAESPAHASRLHVHTHDMSEHQLPHRAMHGDRACFGLLYARHAGAILRFLKTHVADNVVAEDLTSETFLRAWRKMPDFQPRVGKFPAWLYAIARNLVRDHYKTPHRRRELLDGEHHEVAALDQGPEYLALTSLNAMKLRRHMAQLSPDQQQCLRLRFFAGLSLTETAATMHRNTNSIKALQHRAIRALAARFEEAPTTTAG